MNTEAMNGGRLAGRRALITGASSGAGQTTAEMFAREGAQVALVASRPEPLEQAAGAIGERAIAVPADIGDSDQVARAVATAIEGMGGLDVVVNCAAISMGGTLEETTPERWRRTLDVNLSGAYYVSRESARHMLANGGGAIVNVASESASLGMPYYIAYCASKAGMVGMTRAMAVALAPTVTVNVVCPGPIDTPMLQAHFETSPDAKDELMSRVPMGRAASREEIAAGIMYFATDGTCATGASLALDCGTTATV
jgi:NAD(P)-dependent dehydrogenase (short-subunit alcohol dehydrogenase family)